MPTSHRRPSTSEARRRARGVADRFTPQQIRILQAVVDNDGTAAAAAALGLAEPMIKSTLRYMRSKAGVQATYQLTLVAAHRLTPPNGRIQKDV